jgi:hypothetical protein
MNLHDLFAEKNILLAMHLPMVDDLSALQAEIAKLRALCAREALRIEALSHVVQDDDLRVAMHRATFELRAAGAAPALADPGGKS